MIRFFRGELTEEVRDWVNDGLISAEQGEAILARHDRSLVETDRPSLGYRVLSALAILFAGAALLLLLSHNWDQLSRLGRMLGLIAATGLLNGLGVRQWVRGQRDQAVLWFFAGGIVYGASIMLIAQIYHLGEHFPDGLLFWALGVLPLALLTASRLLHVLQLALITIWMLTQWRYGLPWLLPLFAGAALYQVLYRSRSAVLLHWSLLLLLIWLNGLYAWWYGYFHQWISSAGSMHLVLTLLLLLLMHAVALTQLSHPSRGRREDAHSVSRWWFRFLVPLLFLFSYSRVWFDFIRDWTMFGGMVVLPPLLLTMVLVAVLASRVPSARRLELLATGGALTLVLAVIHYAPQSMALAVALAVMVNLLLLIMGIALMHQGLRERRARRFHGGILLLLALGLMRYISLIGDYLSSALMFAIAGGVLFAAARYWKRQASQAAPVHTEEAP
ncbi:MAG: DUF2157 domain-containing protein [Alcanivorax sp.]|nr:DUF2157 domain-containing protein [Alcanivorax sp.]